MNPFSILALTFKHAPGLGRLMKNRVTVESLRPEELKKQNIEAIVLDHDGVLGPSLSFGPDSVGVALIEEMMKTFGPGKVFVLSNTVSRRDAREKAYRQAMPEVIYIKARRKPDQEGLAIASKLSGVPVDRIAVIDDGVLTGALMALEGGAAPIYATRVGLDENLTAWAFRLGVTIPQIIAARLAVIVGGGGAQSR